MMKKSTQLREGKPCARPEPACPYMVIYIPFYKSGPAPLTGKGPLTTNDKMPEGSSFFIFT